MPLKIAVIGGGAAGFFCAVNVARLLPDSKVSIFEKTTKILSKVKISGGGRCNLTHNCHNINQLVVNYPRGQKFLKQAFGFFAVGQTIEWFEKRNVKLKIEADGRIFPTTDNSQTIIDALTLEAQKYQVQVHYQAELTTLQPLDKGFELTFNGNQKLFADVVVVTVGGHSKIDGYHFLRATRHTIIPPVPSLFTFNIPQNPVTRLMGITLPHTTVKIQKSTWIQTAPFLITHWGFSGPAVLKLSAWAARQLAECRYEFHTVVQWVGLGENDLRKELENWKKEGKQKQIINRNPLQLPSRLWEFILTKCQIPVEKLWGEISQKDLNRLVNCLTNDVYDVKGKTTFKEEFVTCGGINLAEIDPTTMQSKLHEGLYFAGEVLDIDGVTGGFNFQAAWTTAFIAASHISKFNQNTIL